MQLQICVIHYIYTGSWDGEYLLYIMNITSFIEFIKHIVNHNSYGVFDIYRGLFWLVLDLAMLGLLPKKHFD